MSYNSLLGFGKHSPDPIVKSHWRLNEESGVRLDRIGGNHMSGINGVSFVSGTWNEKAVHLDGINNQFLFCDQHPTIRLNTTEPLFVSIWGKRDSIDAKPFIGQEGTNSSANPLWRMHYESLSSLDTAVARLEASPVYHIQTSQTSNIGDWNWRFLYYNPSGHAFLHGVNETVYSGNTSTGFSNGATTSRLFIGRDANNYPGEYTSGQFHDVVLIRGFVTPQMRDYLYSGPEPTGISPPSLEINNNWWIGNVGNWDDRNNGPISYEWSLSDSQNNVIASGVDSSPSGYGDFDGIYKFSVRALNKDGNYDALEYYESFSDTNVFDIPFKLHPYINDSNDNTFIECSGLYGQTGDKVILSMALNGTKIVPSGFYSDFKIAQLGNSDTQLQWELRDFYYQPITTKTTYNFSANQWLSGITPENIVQGVNLSGNPSTTNLEKVYLNFYCNDNSEDAAGWRIYDVAIDALSSGTYSNDQVKTLDIVGHADDTLFSTVRELKAIPIGSIPYSGGNPTNNTFYSSGELPIIQSGLMGLGQWRYYSQSSEYQSRNLSWTIDKPTEFKYYANNTVFNGQNVNCSGVSVDIRFRHWTNNSGVWGYLNYQDGSYSWYSEPFYLPPVSGFYARQNVVGEFLQDGSIPSESSGVFNLELHYQPNGNSYFSDLEIDSMSINLIGWEQENPVSKNIPLFLNASEFKTASLYTEGYLSDSDSRNLYIKSSVDDSGITPLYLHQALVLGSTDLYIKSATPNSGIVTLYMGGSQDSGVLRLFIDGGDDFLDIDKSAPLFITSTNPDSIYKTTPLYIYSNVGESLPLFIGNTDTLENQDSINLFIGSVDPNTQLSSDLYLHCDISGESKTLPIFLQGAFSYLDNSSMPLFIARDNEGVSHSIPLIMGSSDYSGYKSSDLYIFGQIMETNNATLVISGAPIIGKTMTTYTHGF